MGNEELGQTSLMILEVMVSSIQLDDTTELIRVIPILVQESILLDLVQPRFLLAEFAGFYVIDVRPVPIGPSLKMARISISGRVVSVSTRALDWYRGDK